MVSTTKSVGGGSSKLVHLLRLRGFVDLIPAKLGREECHLAEFGPPGTFLRENIIKRWWEVMVAAQKNVFPVQRPAFGIISNGQDLASNYTRKNLQQDCVAKFPQVLKLANNKLPLSIVSYGACLSDKTEIFNKELFEKHLLLGSRIKTRLCLQNYIPPSNAKAIQDFWLRTRLSWWKKFSRNPECFSVTSAHINSGDKEYNENECQQLSSLNGLCESHMNIVYQFPWGQEVVETVNNLGNRLFKQLSHEDANEFMIKGAGKKDFIPACIECDMSVESAMAAWLVDAHLVRRPKTTSGKKLSSDGNQVLQLHPHIAPYQVAIVVSSTSSANRTELCYICDHVERDLKKAGVSVFNTSHHDGTLEAHFKRNDQLGILYTVIINQNTVLNGLVNTRSRDTQVKVSSHVTNLVLELARNLKAQLD